MNEATNTTESRIGSDTTEEIGSKKEKVYWYQKLGRSIGASIATCVGALVIISLVSGFSAFAGAQIASSGERHDISKIERSIQDGDSFDQNGRSSRDGSIDEKGLKGKSDMKDIEGRDGNSAKGDSSNAKPGSGNQDTQSDNSADTTKRDSKKTDDGAKDTAESKTDQSNTAAFSA